MNQKSQPHPHAHPDRHDMKDGREDWSRPCDHWCRIGYPHPALPKNGELFT